MTGGVFLIQDDGELVEMGEQPYGSEEKLQELLARYPNLLAGSQIDAAAPRRWLLVSREVGIPGQEYGADRWAIDHLFVDQDAIPTLVEVKRSTNPQIRREVVGQMLDYAANAMAYWRIDALRASFEANCEKQGLDPEVEIASVLGEEEADSEGFWEQVRDNLRAGKVRMIFVADEIPPELQRIVEFLNGQMNPAEVLAVEIKQYVGEKLRTLVPRVIGQAAKQGGQRDRKQWDEPSFVEDVVARHGQILADTARNLIGWAKERSLRLWWGRGPKDGWCYPMLDHRGSQHYLFAISTFGRVAIQFMYMKPPFDEGKRLDLLDRLNNIRSVDLPADGITRRPGFPLSALSDAESLEQFLKTFEWVIEEIRAS